MHMTPMGCRSFPRKCRWRKASPRHTLHSWSCNSARTRPRELSDCQSKSYNVTPYCLWMTSRSKTRSHPGLSLLTWSQSHGSCSSQGRQAAIFEINLLPLDTSMPPKEQLGTLGGCFECFPLKLSWSGLEVWWSDASMRYVYGLTFQKIIYGLMLSRRTYLNLRSRQGHLCLCQWPLQPLLCS